MLDTRPGEVQVPSNREMQLQRRPSHAEPGIEFAGALESGTRLVIPPLGRMPFVIVIAMLDLVIVRNLDVLRARRSPTKTDAPLVVDP